jgi:hypothetical protein
MELSAPVESSAFYSPTMKADEAEKADVATATRCSTHQDEECLPGGVSPTWGSIRKVKLGAAPPGLAYGQVRRCSDGRKAKTQRERRMRAFTVLCLIVCMVGGCTTLQPVANVPGDLSQHFGDGGVLKPGDRVVITTTSGAKHQFRVSSVRDGMIYGDHDSVSFSEIASVQRRETSTAKTTILVVVILGVVGGLAAAINSGNHPNTGF